MELWALIPELIVASFVLILLPVGALLPASRKPLVTWAAIGALILAGGFAARMMNWTAQPVFDGTYAVDPFAVYFKLFACIACMAVLLATESRFKGDRFEAAVAPLILLLALGMMGLGASQNLALIALFIQLVTVPSYILVGLPREPKVVTEAALKLFLFSALAGAIMLFGMSFLYGLTGTLQLQEMPHSLRADAALAAVTAFSLSLVGYGYEITIVPFHFWAPDTYKGAPTPISGLLSVGPKVAALGVLGRTAMVAFPQELTMWQPILAVLAALTMSYGNVLAMRQQSVKRLLAYSSIAQAGYLLVGIAAGNRDRLGLSGFLFYAAVYLFMNLGAFLSVDAMERRSGTDALNEMKGLGYAQPFAAAVLSVSVLALAGFPPFGGFIGKAMLLAASLNSGWLALAVVMALNFAISLYYYLRVIGALYSTRNQKGRVESEPLILRVALAVMLLGTILSGVLPARWVSFSNASATIFGR